MRFVDVQLEERRQHQHGCRHECHDADDRDDAHRLQWRVRRGNQRAVSEERDQAGNDDDGRELRDSRRGVPFVLIAVHQVNAVIDADADEGDHREDREEIERHAGEREKTRRPDEPDDRRQGREQRQAPVAK